MPSRVLNFKTPCQCFLATFPKSSHLLSNIPLKIFGSVAFVHIHSQHRGKLDPRATKCIFLGYSPTKKGYKCYCPRTQKFFHSMDVTFFEEQLFYPTSDIQGENSRESPNWDMMCLIGAEPSISPILESPAPPLPTAEPPKLPSDTLEQNRTSKEMQVYVKRNRVQSQPQSLSEPNQV